MPFLHIGERLGKKVGSEYLPVGPAVIDPFLKQELGKRLTLLQSLLTETHGLIATDWRPPVQARVH